MKRKIKRKMFLMGMAMVAGLPSYALAKGSSKQGYLSGHYPGSTQWATRSLAPDYDDGVMRVDTLYGKLNRLAGAIGYSRHEAEAVRKPAMQLQMLPAAEARQDDPIAASEKRLGLALHIAF